MLGYDKIERDVDIEEDVLASKEVKVKGFNHETVVDWNKRREEAEKKFNESPGPELTNAYHVTKKDFNRNNSPEAPPQICYACKHSDWVKQNGQNLSKLFCFKRKRHCFTMETVRFTGDCDDFVFYGDPSD